MDAAQIRVASFDDVERERLALIERLSVIDRERAELTVLISQRNRQPVEKRVVERLKQRQARLLSERDHAAILIGVCNKRRRELNVSAKALPPLQLSNVFMEIVRGAVPRAQYDQWIDQARKRLEEIRRA